MWTNYFEAQVHFIPLNVGARWPAAEYCLPFKCLRISSANAVYFERLVI